MKTFFKHFFFTAIVCLFLSACSITYPRTATSNPVGSKVGTAKATIVLGLYFDQDASIQTAAKNGGITRISTVDVKMYNVLYVFVTYETIVTGE
jgi:hypothetical protein